jgi:hypothetical protein
MLVLCAAGGARAAPCAADFYSFAERESVGDELRVACGAAQGRAGAASASLRHALLRSACRSARTVDALRHLLAAMHST